ncbi:MAG TPA: SPOR domain-containing protein [Tenuifilum sp.]|jgi:septal ring-binding cell division protein DamX|nr:SPOR domain-containing protein [Tenuifilum sp.]
MDRSILAELIRKNKRLIIPNVGAFLHRDTESNTQLSVTFSPFLKYNDGQLEDLLISNHGLSKIEAAEQVKKLSIEIIDEIKESGSYSIPGIGVLLNDSKGSISLASEESSSQSKPTETENGKNIKVTTTNTPFETDANTNDKKQTINDSILNDEIVHEENAITKHYTEVSPGVERVNTNALDSIIVEKSLTENSNQIEKDLEQSNMKGASKKKPSSILRVIVFIAVSLFVILTFAFILRELAFAPDEADWESIKNKPEKVEPIKLPSDYASKSDDFDKKFEASNPDDEESKTATGNAQPTQTTEEVIEKSLTQNARADNPSTIYSLVVGSFAEKANAQNFVNNLKAKGFSAEVYSKPNGKYLAVIGRFSSKDEANKQKDKLKSQFQGIWIISR